MRRKAAQREWICQYRRHKSHQLPLRTMMFSRAPGKRRCCTQKRNSHIKRDWTGAKPPQAKAKGDLCATESETELPLVAPEVIETAAASADTSFDPIDEIEQELFAPSTIESAPVPENQPPRAKLLEELLPQPTLTEMAPAPSMTPIETVSSPPPVAASVLEKPSASPTRPVVRSMPRHAPTDPLAALRAMTDEERIALFS